MSIMQSVGMRVLESQGFANAVPMNRFRDCTPELLDILSAAEMAEIWNDDCSISESYDRINGRHPSVFDLIGRLNRDDPTGRIRDLCDSGVCRFDSRQISNRISIIG